MLSQLALVMTLAICSAAVAQTEEPAVESVAPAVVAIDIDATVVGTPLQRVWAYFGYDEVNYTTTAEGEDLLRALVAANTATVRTRTHFLFNTGDGTPSLKWGSTNIYTEDAAGNAVYNYALIDQIMDSTIEAGAFPLVEIGFMPQALSSQPEPYQPRGPYVLEGGSFYPPKDYLKWGELVRAWASHVKERYPNAEETWQWELWNEPDIGYWQGTFEEFAQLYDSTEAALHAVFPNASLGGPAVTNPENGFLSQFLQHCATGTNSVSGQSGTRLDMVSFHSKGGVGITEGHVQMDLGNQLRLHRTGFETVAASQFAKTPVVISEADPDGCAACPVSTAPHNAYRTSPAYGAYEVAMMKRSLDLAAELGVNLKGVLTWAFTFPDTDYFAGYRALRTGGIDLPVFNAFKLLGSMSGNRLPVVSTGARPLQDILDNGVRNEPDVDALAATDADRIQVLVWNYHDDLVAAEPSSVTLNIELPAAFAESAIVTHTRIDAEHGDAHTAWLLQGSPQPPSAEQLTELQLAMNPVMLDQRVIGTTGGTLTFAFDLPRFGISLLTLEPSGGDAAAPTTPARRVDGNECSCRLPGAMGQAPLPALLWPLLAAVLVTLRRRSHCGLKGYLP